ncbi:MAG: zinc-ribbon domain-containing protein [Deltaproteobacteria bacterium]|nr:zinc-ribbon domain-containing protein [Deltaproteobacteria bacterium]
MIITCEQCQTQFQLDESRIPEHGARVRCSRCEHAFFVKSASEAGDPVGHAVEQALVEDQEQRSGSTQELDPTAAVQGEAEEESDWEFNDDRPDPEPDLTAAREVVDDLLGAVDEAPLQEADDGLLGATSDLHEDLAEDPAEDLAEDPAEGLGGDLAEGLGEDVDEGLGGDLAEGLGEDVDEGLGGDLAEGLGEDVDDEIDSLLDSTGYSAELGEPEPAALAAEEPADALAELEPQIASAEPEPSAPLVAEEPAAPLPAGTAAQPAGEELGSPENWDFFSDEPDGSLSEETGFEQTPIGQLELAPAPTLERPPVDVDAEPSQTRHRLQLVAHVAGWLSVALLVIGGLHGGIVAQRAGPLALRTTQAAAGLEATGIEGRWLDNAVAGPIYVISGELLRAGSRPAVSGAWLAVRLFDENGVLLVEKAAAVGPALPEARLREEDPRELRAAQAQGALAMAGVSLAPGDAWAVQAILSHLPVAASRFDLAAIPLEAAAPAPEVP